MRPSRSNLAVLLLAVGLGPGCWFATNQAATAEYDRRVVVASMRVAQLEESLADAEARLDQTEEWVRQRGQAESEQLENLEQVNEALRQLRGQIELLDFSVQEAQDILAELQIDQERRFLHAERRLDQLEQYLGVKAPPPPTDAELGLAEGDGVAPGEGEDETDPEARPRDGEEPAQEAADLEAPEDADGHLEMAIEHMKAGRQGVARVLLEKAVDEFPGDELLPEIRYRIAETWFNDEQWQKAAMAFQVVLDNHGKSSWAPWSMLRQGECFQSMGDASASKLFFEELIRMYPKSPAAKDARKALQSI